MEQINILDQLVDDYSQNKVSALVGAGFSKNVSSLYPNWIQLLEDMYKDVYSDDIEIYYQNYVHQKWLFWKKDKQIKDEYVSSRIQTEDLLNLVSKYIQRKGYREVVEVYIEERTPLVYKEEEEIKLKGKDTVEKLDINVFTAHKELLMCDKFLNIYTTNYDNLLEFTNKYLLPEGKPFENECIINSARLSNQINKRNIIKIHGSLREHESDSFGFDDDNNLCYIIAQEDYDTYLKKHEAFSYMMRIAMLSGVFCLIGFSGTDPNYLAWLKWLRDIVVKNKDHNTKIYLISIDEKKEVESKEQILFNSNYHIEVLYLFEDVILSRLGFEDEYIKKLKKSKNSNDYRTIITAFLTYLRKNSSKVVNDYRKILSIQNSPIDNEGNISYESTFYLPYKQLWREAVDKVQNKEPLGNIVDQIVEETVKHRISKLVYPQEHIVSVLEDRSALSKSEANLFAMAVKETGLLPCFLKEKVNQCKELCENELWHELIHRNNTILGEQAKVEGNTDFSQFENIMRSLFALDFESAKQQIIEWNPTSYWVQHHSMLTSLYQYDIEESRNNINLYINDPSTPRCEKVFASNIGNYISEDGLRNPYDCTLDYEQGFDGLGDIMNYIIGEIMPKNERPKTLGWIGSSYKVGPHNRQLKKSVKLITFLLESGINLCHYGKFFMSIENWYLVVHNILGKFPYPCYYYSCQYQDKAVLRRIGQEFSFSKSLENINEELLKKSLLAVVSPDTPPLFLTGLYILSGRLYISVDEEIWFELFKTNIVGPLFSNFATTGDNEELYENFKMGVGALKTKENVEYIFNNILNHFEEEPDNALSIICDNLNLGYLGTSLSGELENLLLSVIHNTKSQRIFAFIAAINDDIPVSHKIINAAVDKMRSIKEDELTNNPFTLMNMILFSNKDEALQQMLRPKFLQTDMWHCGLIEDGSGYSNPRYIRMNIFQKNIAWSDEDFECIKNNLKSNISKFMPIIDKKYYDSFQRSERVKYLCDIKQFIEGLDEERRVALVHEYNIVKKYLDESCNAYSFESELLSEQSADVSNAIKLLEVEISLYGLECRLDEFQLLLDRAILMQSSAMRTNLGTISHILKNHFDVIDNARLTKKILSILRIYKNKIEDLQDMELNLYWVFNHLHKIANELECNGVCDDSTKFWTTDKWVLKFVRF